jgi:DNA-binding XRE family transcriptional regulator
VSPDDYKAHREKLGLTQAGLAARLGLPRTAIVKREAGDQRITEEAALALRALSPARARRSGGSNAEITRGT